MESNAVFVGVLLVGEVLPPQAASSTQAVIKIHFMCRIYLFPSG
ncbi:hypothetical protein [Thermobaculum terrenum]|nr:hypothetical protein [Thermobaculum terrenum]